MSNSTKVRAGAASILLVLSMAGTARAATINGTPGNDHIRGTKQNDTINAGAGNDKVSAFSAPLRSW